MLFLHLQENTWFRHWIPLPGVLFDFILSFFCPALTGPCGCTNGAAPMVQLRDKPASALHFKPNSYLS
jgi:hypothetical protein